jgi:hypothetical protein
VNPPSGFQPTEGITPVMQRILDALAELEVLSVTEPDRIQVAFLAGYTHLQSTGFVKALGALSAAALVRYPTGGRVALSDLGRSLARYPDRPRSSVEIQARVLELLGGVHERVLRPLIDAYPDPIERTELMRAAGYTHLQSTGFVKALGRLRSLGFVDYPTKGTAVARPVLFLEAGQ